MTLQHKTAEDLIASLDAFIMSRPAAPKPITREEAAAIRADLDARQRAGRTVMLRNNKGHFIGSVKVATFGAAAPIPEHNAPKAKVEAPARPARPVTAETVAVVTVA